MWYKRTLQTVCLPLLYAASVGAATLIVPPSADTTLIQTAPTNNMGAQLFVNAGANNLRPPEANRGLFKFDLSGIPTGAQITSAQVSFWVVHEPANGEMASEFSLRRVLKPWGEGNKTTNPAGSPGLGQPATAGEATWRARFAKSTNTWTKPGGAISSDFSDTISGEEFIYGIDQSPYLFASTPQLISDVQAWVDAPQTNYGWVLMSESEDVGGTARRFGSREDPDNAPSLTVEFTAPVTLHLDARQDKPGHLQLQFLADQGQSYGIDYSPTLVPASWLRLTNIAAATTNRAITIPQTAVGTERFYRLRSP